MYTKYYNTEIKELNDRAIIKAIKEAQSDYKQGAIIECRDVLPILSEQLISLIKLMRAYEAEKQIVQRGKDVIYWQTYAAVIER